MQLQSLLKNEQQVISVGDRSSKQTFEKDLLTQNECVDFEYAKPGHGTKERQKWNSSYPFCLASVHIRSLQVEVVRIHVREKEVCDTHAYMIKVILHDYICYMQLTSRNTD